MPGEHEKRRVKEKLLEEFKLFLGLFAFLTLTFTAFLTHRRLISSAAGITYLHYGAGVIKAAVIAKIILAGQALKLGKRWEDQPLIIAVILFGLLVAAFNVLERVIEGLLRGLDWRAIANLLVMSGVHEIFAGTLMVMVSFIAFFAFWETGRVLGTGKLFQLFFHKRAA